MNILNRIDIVGLRRKTGRWLSYINRARQYVGILNSSLLLIILLKTFGIVFRWYWYPLLVIGTVIIFLIVGYFDTRLGIRKAEMLSGEINSPIRMDMHRMIKRIYKDMYENNNAL